MNPHKMLQRSRANNITIFMVFINIFYKHVSNESALLEVSKLVFLQRKYGLSNFKKMIELIERDLMLPDCHSKSNVNQLESIGC